MQKNIFYTSKNLSNADKEEGNSHIEPNQENVLDDNGPELKDAVFSLFGIKEYENGVL